MPEVLVGHPCVLNLDSRLRGNDVQKTKKWGNSCPSSYCLMKKDSGQAGMTQHHIHRNSGRTFFNSARGVFYALRHSRSTVK